MRNYAFRRPLCMKIKHTRLSARVKLVLILVGDNR